MSISCYFSVNNYHVKMNAPLHGTFRFHRTQIHCVVVLTELWCSPCTLIASCRPRRQCRFSNLINSLLLSIITSSCHTDSFQVHILWRLLYSFLFIFYFWKLSLFYFVFLFFFWYFNYFLQIVPFAGRRHHNNRVSKKVKTRTPKAPMTLCVALLVICAK